MDWTTQPSDQPLWSPPHAPTDPAAAGPTPIESDAQARRVPAARHAMGGMKRTIATALLAVGLLAVGGVAVVNAADPSASAAPNATTQPSTGGGSGSGTSPQGQAPSGQTPSGRAGHDCPDRAGQRGTTPSPSAGSGGTSGSEAPSSSDL
jgi:hypothetical protein